MAVRTNWHEDADRTGSSVVDPFDLPSSAPVAVTAPLSLDLPFDELERRIKMLLHREAFLCKEGLTCAIKDNPEGTCLGCPLNEVGSDSAKGALCKIGCEQERVQTMMLAKHAQPAQPKW